MSRLWAAVRPGRSQRSLRGNGAYPNKFYTQTWLSAPCYLPETLGPRPLVSVFVWKRGYFFLRSGLSSKRIRRKRSPKTHPFKNALQSGDFEKRQFAVLVWTYENGGFWKRLRHGVGSSLARARDETKSTWWREALLLSHCLLGLLASIMARFQSHFAMLDVQGDYARRRRNIIFFHCRFKTTGGVKRLNRGRQARVRRFWVRLGRTSAWWDNFVDQVVTQEEWRKNFRMSQGSVCKFTEERRPYIEGKDTIMRSPVSAYALIKRWYHFQSLLRFRTGINDSETQHVDADIFWNGGKKNLRFQTKTDTCGRA